MAWSIRFHALGAQFKPSQINYSFTEAFDAGAIMEKGHYANKPAPYGTIVIEAPKEIPNQDRISYVVRAAQSILPELIQAGVTKWYLDIGRFYSTQCNESYSSEELALMASLNCHLNYSAYKVSKKEERELNEEYGGFEVLE